LNGQRVGLACSEGLFHDQRLVEKGNRANWAAARKLLVNRMTEAAVIENGGEIILGEGLAYDRCQVGVVTDIDPAKHYGDFYIETPEQLFNVFRTQVDVVLPDGVAVLNGNDPLVAEMASLCDGEVIFFGADPEAAVIREHLAQGKRAVIVRNGFLTLASGDQDNRFFELTGNAKTGFKAGNLPAENVLAAAAVVWALGLAPGLIRAGIESFEFEG
jgi:cyanophycin synthetase